MKSFCFSTTYRADPKTVFDALTTQAGLSGWWAKDCDVKSEVGFEMTFRFDGKSESRFRIDSLILCSEIIWTCLKHPYHDDEWVGTQLIFGLSPSADSRCKLDFVHKGLTPDLKCYAHCSKI